MTQASDPIAFDDHDHDRCVGGALQSVEKACARDSLRLTPVRKRVLEILLEEHRAMGAYDILERLREEGLGSQPPVAYRALDFLVEYGFAHRIHRLNAFIACVHPDDLHTPAFLICRKCNLVAETAGGGEQGQLGKEAEELGFRIERVVIEAVGLCPGCRQDECA